MKQISYLLKAREADGTLKEPIHIGVWTSEKKLN